jgi:hypothetical protein
VSEELENSLQQAIETYLGKRLAAIDEQLNRLQSDFDEALSRVRESSAGESLDASPLSAAIFAHLQTARSQRLSGSTHEGPQSSNEISVLKRAVEEIERQPTHADILGALLRAAVQFAERGALFVIRNEQAIGWRECEASDPTNVELIGGVSLPLSADTLLGRAAHSHAAWSGAPGENADDSLLMDQLGGDPQAVAAVPLVVRGKVVAVLYADSTAGASNAVNVDALELLTRVAAMAVNLAAAPRGVPAKAEVSTPTADSQPQASAMPVEVSAGPVHEDEPAYTPEVEPQPGELASEPSVEEVSVTAEPEFVSAESSEPPVEEAPIAAEPEIVQQEVAAPVEATSAAVETENISEPQPEPATEAAPSPQAAPTFPSQYASPLGNARRYGVSEPDLPIEVGEDERRLHNDARRFARLLVSEIKLYNEPKVKEGRNRSDIYERLRDDIDRSRQMYDKRVAPPVAARHDYFHQELVNTLAEGDPAKLGETYPGAVLVAN